MGTIIKCHNARVCGAEHERNDQTRHCNCQNSDHCPFNGECLASSIVYEATVDTDNTPMLKTYIGSTETPFKQWLVNHLTSFRHDRYENSIELSKHVWKLKREGKTFRMSGRILRKASANSSLSKQCNLCLTKKLIILSADKTTLLNKRSQLVSKCCHQNKFSLLSFGRAVTWPPYACA